MYKNFLIVASKIDKAGINITTQLSQYGNMNFYLVENEVLFTENLDTGKFDNYDFIIFASRHASENPEAKKTLSVHAPGNFGKAEFGGKEKKVCKTSALFQKQLFEKLKEISEKFSLEKYDLTMECTHHGPLINKPCIFVEIGPTEEEWKDRRAGFVVAKAIYETINSFKENPYNEVAIGIGGSHYCPAFNKLQMDSNIAISHVIPQYVFPLTEEMVREAIAGTDENVDILLMDWKGLGNVEEREKVLAVVNKFYIQKRKTSEIGK